MDYTRILITGATGAIGKAVLDSSLNKKIILAPKHSEMDITNQKEVAKYFNGANVEAVIHCAAMTSGRECEKNPIAAIKTNIVGTANIAEEALKQNIRLLYLSTDYVYPCTDGPYSEKDEAIPFTVYGWTKLGGECVVKSVPNHCIIRTSLLDPKKIIFDTAPTDAYFSKIPIDELVKSIIFLLNSDFVGIINVGKERISIYDAYRKYKPKIKPISIKEIPKENQRAIDSSLDIDLWRKISKNR